MDTKELTENSQRCHCHPQTALSLRGLYNSLLMTKRNANYDHYYSTSVNKEGRTHGPLAKSALKIFGSALTCALYYLFYSQK